MKTKIYKSYAEFLKRKNKDENGVSEEFAKNNPDFEKENATNKGCYDCFNCSDCSSCSSCSNCSYCYDCSYCSNCSICSYCSYCHDCSDCFNCSDCSSCSSCSNCSYCYDCYDKKADVNAPIVKDLNKKVLEAVTKGSDALEMNNWHTCKTTHCRAGWFVHLAGEDGYKLEKETSTLFAAMQIHKASTGKSINPCEFFVSNEESMKLIKEAAEEN